MSARITSAHQRPGHLERLLLIANPAARRVRTERRTAIEQALSRRYVVESIWSLSVAHAEEIARTAAREGVSVVAAMGGDGLVSHVMSGVAGTAAALAIIPAGTTNASARSLGIPASAEAAAQALVANPVRRPVPTATVTVSGVRGDFTVHALSQIGVGFDAEVVDRAERNQQRKRAFGELHLATTAFSVAGSWPAARNRTLRVASESRSCDASTVSIQVRWPYTYFGPRSVAFTRRPGLGMNVLVVRDVSALAFVRTVVRSIGFHNFDHCSGIELWPGCRRLVVEAAPGMIAQADGEPLGVVNRIEVVWSFTQLQLANPPAGPPSRAE